MTFLKRISHVFLGTLSKTILVFIALAMILCGLGLTALYLVRYVELTPEIRTLKCMIGFVHEDCPQYKTEMTALQDELKALQDQKSATEQKLAQLKEAGKKLANLKRIEDAVDTVTLFKEHYDPVNNFRVTVGTAYSKLTETDVKPEYFFCYISLEDTQGVDRNLYVRNSSGDISISAQTLRQAGLSQDTLDYARSVCNPYLIGGAK